MFPVVFLAVPLLLPALPVLSPLPVVPAANSVVERRADVLATPAPAPADGGVAALVRKVPEIPPLYAPDDGGFTVSLLPGASCSAACVRLQVRF